MTTQRVRELVAAEQPRITAIRHDLHRHPEIMFAEHRTSALVRKELTDLGIRHVTSIGGESPGTGTGVAAIIPATPGQHAPRTVALRADMDALPIHETTGLPYASTTPGAMHACGHDGHTAILLGTARVLSRLESRPNNTILLFQPAEEGGGGGEKMCRDGALDGRLLGHNADCVFGLHGWPDQLLGTVAVRNGPMLAATDDFEVTVVGKGCHAAQPHVGIDPIVTAAAIITALQTIASRRFNPFEPFVLSVGMIQGGTADNIIPDTCTFIGTMRTLSDTARAAGQAEFRRIVADVARAHGAEARIDWHVRYPVTRNDPRAADKVRRVAAATVGPAALIEREFPTMGGEDFSYYGAHAPAAFFFLGLKPPQSPTYPNLHTPGFDFNDSALGPGIEMMCGLAIDPIRD